MKGWLVMTAVVGTVAVLGAQGRDRAMVSLVQAERAFAKMSVDTTQRQAFLANFADDGVWFDPGPSNTREALRTPPPAAAAAEAAARTLDWEPVNGDMSASGDLGYTTGPWVRTVRGADRPPATGWFFSVWKRQGDGPWRVAADFGIPAPGSGGLRSQEFRQAEVPPVAPSDRPDPKEVLDQYPGVVRKNLKADVAGMIGYCS